MNKYKKRIISQDATDRKRDPPKKKTGVLVLKNEKKCSAFNGFSLYSFLLDKRFFPGSFRKFSTTK